MEKYKYCLIDKKVSEWLDNCRNNNIHGFCIDKFKYDYIIDDIFQYKIGDKININNKYMEIAYVGKKCYCDCPFFKKYQISCKLKNGVIFAN